MDKSEIKIIANYLPQFHSIPENDLWWGDGYTDWMAVRKAQPVYNGQYQPRVPLDGNYYDLSDPSVIAWQAALARKYGIWGFGIYHYWFSPEQNLLTRPAYNLLNQPEIDINYMFIWDNCSWVRTWSNIPGNDWTPEFDGSPVDDENAGVLAKLAYGGRGEWEKHFEYLLPFFLDERYIKIDGRPVFAFMNPNIDYHILSEMMKAMDEMAKAEGFPGLFVLSHANWKRHFFPHEFQYNPTSPNDLRDYLRYGLHNKIRQRRPSLWKINYDSAWNHILNTARVRGKKDLFYSGFVGYDDTPRRGENARIYVGQTPEKFEYYLSELLNISASHNKEFVFLTAWNEWGEGAYLEPDDENGYAYLEAVRAALGKIRCRNGS